MKTSSMFHSPRRLAVGAGALILAVGGGAAYASASSTQARTGSPGAHPIVSAIIGELGVSAQQLRTDLASGQTLAQIATANGQSVSGLEQAIMTGVTTRLDQAVAAGKLTSQAEQTALSRVSGRLGTLVNVTHPVAHLLMAQRVRAGILRVGAGYVGVTPQQLRSDLRSGKTLAQVATDNGKTASGLEQAIVTAVTSRLDQAVAAGTITSQHEQTIVSNLQTRLDTLVNRSFAR